MTCHELKNLLAGGAMSAETLTELRCDAPTHARDAERIRRYATRMTRLVSDLVDVISIDAGRLAVAPARNDAGELVRETIEVFEPAAVARRITLDRDVKGGKLLARYDHERVLQVLANLVANALKFTPEGGHVCVRVEPAGREVRFSVADDGPGIEPDMLARIFDQFWQGAERKTRAGLGLGLYISKCIVEAHGGKIWAESRVGEGSTFFFTLPAGDG